MEKLSKIKLLDCIKEIANTYSMTTKELLTTMQSSSYEDKKVVFPTDPHILQKDGKIYVTNLECMLAKNLYDNKSGQIIKLSPKYLSELNIGPPPTNWWVSEKLDGIRAIWDGEKFLSRNSQSGLGSKVFSYVPQFIIDGMPGGVALDGEIWLGRNKFNEMSSISNWIPNRKFTSEEIDKKWENIVYKVFDIPNSTLAYEERMKELDKIILQNFSMCNQKKIRCPLEKVDSIKVSSPEHLQEIYRELTKEGAEGVMLRAPNSPYEFKRSPYLLKFKIKDDAEGIVIQRLMGTGRLNGLLGSLKVELIKNSHRTGIITHIGTGFNDEERTNDQTSSNFIPVGSVISFSYMELTEDSVRHPSYRGIRTDVPIIDKKGVEQIDNYNEYIILLLKQLIQEVESVKEPNWQFKKKQYNAALNAFIKNKESVKSVEDGIRILRENGMKLDKEEEYFEKNKEYKSAIVKKIHNMIVTGNLPIESEEFTAITTLSKIPEIGESKAKKLYDEYGVISIAELKILYEQNNTVLTQKQATGLKYYDDLLERIPRDEMDTWNTLLKTVYDEVIAEINPKNPDYVMVGSYRRGAKSSGDIDILITSEDKGENMMKLFKIKLLEKSIIENNNNIFAAGNTKIMAVVKILDKYRHLDIFYHPRDIYPFAILHSTGSASFNPELRTFFISKGFSLSEKGIKRGNAKGPDIASDSIKSKIDKDKFETEEDIFKFIGLPYIPPNSRTGGINFEKISK
jgi:DNA polymerase/3'-5' exonuclease PolX